MRGKAAHQRTHPRRQEPPGEAAAGRPGKAAVSPVEGRDGGPCAEAARPSTPLWHGPTGSRDGLPQNPACSRAENRTPSEIPVLSNSLASELVFG